MKCEKCEDKGWKKPDHPFFALPFFELKQLCDCEMAEEFRKSLNELESENAKVREVQSGD